MNLKDTLNLPDAEFSIPMKANLTQQEPTIQALWNEIGIYERIQEARKDAPVYLLHDGPPYTNGPIHIGTALNKILKDFVVKSRTMMGFRCPYVPGYDNHGLPIEQAVLKKLHEQKIDPDILTLRKACREHAQHFIGVQNNQFRRLGVFGMWDKPYTSMNYRFEAEIIRVFKRLIEGGYVYRGLRPVLWSPTSRTALADTEIIYKEGYTSTSIYVAFPLKEDKSGTFAGLNNVSCVIWTTTPWTIPANLAVAFHPHLTYVVARVGDQHFIVLEDLLAHTAEKAGWSSYEVVKSFQGREVEYDIFAHPVFGRDSLAVLADYVTTEDGTGIVHTAPGHGREDFITGQKYHLDVLCPVDEKGVLTEEAGEFAGTYFKKCDEVVVNRLRELGALLHSEPFTHSYPHAERDEQPVIFRATEQWFVHMDAPFHLDPSITLRQKMLQEIEKVTWHPEGSISRIRAMIENRPDWCVSRQRPWGVGIPIVYGAESGEPVLDPVAIESIANYVSEHGSDAWYDADASAMLPAGYTHPKTGETSFRKEVDVFDVWFDSGSTHLAVLEGNVEPSWKEDLPADLYLEGSDQHRGWFNVSLILGTACRGHAPYKSVLTHGFLVLSSGEKMSKRKGNVIDPVEASDRIGAEIIRYWAASVNYVHDAPVGEDLFQAAGESYRTVRNTLRFLLSNLSDYDPADQGSPSKIDRWIVQAADQLVEKVRKAYEEFDFKEAMSLTHNFCVNELSRFYLDAIKDVMYADAKASPRRRAAQHACHVVLDRLVGLCAPILVHTAEETYQRIPHIHTLPSVHMETFRAPISTYDAALNQEIAELLAIRTKVFAEFELQKAKLGVKNTQEIEADLVVLAHEAKVLQAFGDDLANLFKMADVRVKSGDGFSVGFKPSSYLECSRSRLRRADVEIVEIDGEQIPLSKRDREVLGV